MKRLLLTLSTLILALGVTACSPDGGTASSSPDPEAMLSEFESAVAPPEGVEPAGGVDEIKVGEPINFDCYSHLPCDAYFTPEDVTMSDACIGRADDYGSGPELVDGKTYLQVSGIFEVRTADNGWTMLHDPQIIGSEGFTETPEMAINCHEGDGYESWSNTLDEGQKAKHFGVWIVPEDAEYMLLENTKMKLPKVEEAGEIVDTTPAVSVTQSAVPETTAAPAPGPASPAPGPASSAPVFVECWENDAALMSDQTIIYDPINCDLDGSVDPSTVPYAEGGTCPAAICGYGTNDQGQRNPTSGEIQTLHGCQEGYITDAELCDAVAWVETHEY